MYFQGKQPKDTVSIDELLEQEGLESDAVALNRPENSDPCDWRVISFDDYRHREYLRDHFNAEGDGLYYGRKKISTEDGIKRVSATTTCLLGVYKLQTSL